MKAIPNLLDDPHFFYCERHKCTLRKFACLLRQLINVKRGRKPIELTPVDMTTSNLHRKIAEECRDCEQGRKIKKEFPDFVPQKVKKILFQKKKRIEVYPMPYR